MIKKLRKRIIMFSTVTALVLLIFVVGVFAIFTIVQPYFSELKNLNNEALNLIECKKNLCDISKFINNPTDKNPDYILTKERFFIRFTNDYPGFWLNFSEPDFIDDFREPKSYNSPTGERWRLYSQNKLIDSKNIEIIVGWIEKTPQLIVETPSSPEIDRKLKEELDNIAEGLKIEKGKIVLSSKVKPKVDGYQVVDSSSKEVISWSWSIPAFFPKEKTVSKRSISFFRERSKIYLVRTDYNEDLVVTSLKLIGNLWWLAVNFLLIFLFVFLLSYVFSSTFLKKYFIFFRKHPHSISEALKSGEGQEIEFKRGIVDDDLLKSITAFANTNDGTIFIGIDDDGKILGIDAKTPKDKERFIHHIFTLIKNKIKPGLLVRIDFEEIRDYIIAKIFIPRGEEPLYFMDGVIYIRHGDSDIKADPELVKKILTEYSF